MKFNKAYGIVALALFMVVTTGCSDQDYTVTNKGANLLTITSNANDLFLHESNHATEAIAIEWSTGENFGTGNSISYTLELAETATDFAAPIVVIEESRQTYSWRPSTENLNDILINRFGLMPGDGISLDARVTAHVAGMEEVQTAVTTFTVVGYEPVSRSLYIVGDAAPNGWDADNASEMQCTENGVFTWTGDLRAGDFKFITTREQFLPSYNSDGKGGLTLRSDDSQPDEKFKVSEAHCYQVDVNLLDLTISIEPVEGVSPQFDTLYFVGEETGWSFRPMVQDPIDPFLFRIGMFFRQGGEFKFGTSDGSWENMYKATQPNAPFTDSSVEFIQGYDPDNKWNLTSDEANYAYKICLDIRTGAERMIMALFNPYPDIYLVGDATPNGWDLANATPMVRDESDPNIFTWSGHLNVGEVKLSADKQDDWNGAWFMASSENETVTGQPQQVLFIDKSSQECQQQYVDFSTGSIDYKWKITEAGEYTITLNQLLEEIVISRN